MAWLAHEATDGDRAVILSLVSRLAKNGVKENWHGLFRKIKGDLITAYIPGHCGISYNSEADKLAGSADTFGELVLTPSEVLGRTLETLTEKDWTVQGSRWSTEMLLEWGRKRGGGARLLLRGKRQASIQPSRTRSKKERYI